MGAGTGNFEGVPSGLSLYEYKVSKAGRIIWSVGIDFVPLVGAYQQTIRVWAVHMHDHDAAQVSIRRVCAIHARGLTSLIRRQHGVLDIVQAEEFHSEVPWSRSSFNGFEICHVLWSNAIDEIIPVELEL